MGLLRYLLKRLLLVIPTVLGVTILVFLLVHMIPGNPVDVMLGDKATEEARQALTERLGLDKPLYEQYWTWLTNALQGDLGISVRNRSPVTTEILTRLPATIELALTATVLAAVVGIIVGVSAAYNHNTKYDHALVTLSLIGVSIPIFWLGIMLIFLFAAVLGWLPVSGRLTMGAGIEEMTGFYLLDSLIQGDMSIFWDSVRHLILPAVSLATIPLSQVVRVTRSSMLDVLGEDYVRTARAKGLPYRAVIYKHALKNALIPVATVIGLQTGKLLAGAILTEMVFSWPGTGRLLINSIYNRDYPMIQGIVLILALAFILVNIIVDLLYAKLDPRIRFE
jgi:peptide/nickel transport system permease protein